MRFVQFMNRNVTNVRQWGQRWTKRNFIPRLGMMFSGPVSAQFSAHIRVASARGAGLTRDLQILVLIGYPCRYLDRTTIHSRMCFHTQVPKRSRQKLRSMSLREKQGPDCRLELSRRPTQVTPGYPDTNPNQAGIRHLGWGVCVCKLPKVHT